VENAGPVEVGGLQIRAGDVVIMDADGAVVVAAERAAEVLQAGLAREAKEADLRTKFQAGQISIDVYGIREQVASVLEQ
jgi:4-hydroxy-4-methyl-2-oxoglutarate aldolase